MAQQTSQPGLGKRNSRQELISEGFLAGLAQEVETILLGSTAMQGIATKGVKKVQSAKGGVATNSMSSLLAANSAAASSVPKTLNGQILALRKALVVKFGSLTHAFDALDLDKSGAMTYTEFKSGLDRFKIPWKEVVGSIVNLRAIFRALDVNDAKELQLEHWTRGASGEGGSGAEPDEEPFMVAAGDELLSAFPEPAGERLQEAGSRVTRLQEATTAWRQHGPAKSPHGYSLFGEAQKFRAQQAPERAPVGKAEVAQMWEKRQELLKKKQDALQLKQQEKLEQEVSELRAPEVSKKSTRLAENYRSGAFEERRQRRLDEVRAKEEAECTFKPQVCKGSRQTCNTMLETGGAWHDRMHSVQLHTIQDRMGCKARRDVDREVESTFTPMLSPKAQRIQRDGHFQRLFAQVGRAPAEEEPPDAPQSRGGSWLQDDSPKLGRSISPNASRHPRAPMMVGAPPEIMALLEAHSVDREGAEPSRVTSDEVLDPISSMLRDIWTSLDENGDGQVQARELIEAIRASPDIAVFCGVQSSTRDALRLLFDGLDANHDGNVSLEEFMAQYSRMFARVSPEGLTRQYSGLSKEEQEDSEVDFC